MRMLIVPVYVAHDLCEVEDCDFAIIDVDTTAEEIKQYVEEARRLTEKFDCTGAELVVAGSISVVGFSVVAGIVDSEILGDITDTQEPAIVDMTEDDAAKIDQSESRIECTQLHASDGDVWWSFYPKHANIMCETYRFCAKKFAEGEVA